MHSQEITKEDLTWMIAQLNPDSLALPFLQWLSGLSMFIWSCTVIHSTERSEKYSSIACTVFLSLSPVHRILPFKNLWSTISLKYKSRMMYFGFETKLRGHIQEYGIHQKTILQNELFCSDEWPLICRIYERKYEIDSILHVLKLSASYYDATKDLTPFQNADWKRAIASIISIIQDEQVISELSIEPIKIPSIERKWWRLQLLLSTRNHHSNRHSHVGRWSSC